MLTNNKPTQFLFCQMYKSYVIEDKNIKQMMEIYSVGRNTIRLNLKRFNIKLENSPSDIQLTKEQRKILYNKELLIKRYETETARQIAESIGTRHAVVVRFLKKYGCEIKKSYKKCSNPLLYDKEWLQTQYIQNNKSLQIIGDELGTSRMNVQRKMKAVGIEIKSSTDYSLSSIHIHKLIPLLEKYNINHITSYKIIVDTKNRCFTYEIDEYLPDLKVFLELQGDYWHGYTERKNSVINQNMGRDKRKLQYLNKHYPDHKVVYIRDTEMDTIAESIIKKLSNGIIVETFLP